MPGNYGKCIRASKFCPIWDEYITGQITQTEAVKRVGITQPTFIKWSKEIFNSGCFHRNLSFLIWDFDEAGNVIKDIEVGKGWFLVD